MWTLCTVLLPCDGLLESISEQGYNIGWRDLSYTAQARRLTKEPPFIVFRKGAAKKLLDNLEGFAAAGTPPQFFFPPFIS
jgi:predicted deacetylase